MKKKHGVDIGFGVVAGSRGCAGEVRGNFRMRVGGGCVGCRWALDSRRCKVDDTGLHVKWYGKHHVRDSTPRLVKSQAFSSLTVRVWN